MLKETLGAVAILLTFVAFVPYLASILGGRTRPHVFSWLIWGSTTFVVFLAQLQDGGGVGAWPIGVSGGMTVMVVLLAYRARGDTSIARVDWWFFGAAMSSLPIWYLTADPFWAVLILTSVDLVGFGPTLRKAYVCPFEERVTFYSVFALRNGLAIAALNHYSMTTVLFPAATGVACCALVGLIAYRRAVISSMRRGE